MPGVAAWVVGVAVGLAPTVGVEGWSNVRPAAVMAFGAAFVVYFAPALVGMEPRREEVETSEGG